MRSGDVGEEHAGGLLRKDDALVASAGDGGWIDVRFDVSRDFVHRLSRGNVRRRRRGRVHAVRARVLLGGARRDVHAVSSRHVQRSLRRRLHRQLHPVRRG